MSVALPVGGGFGVRRGGAARLRRDLRSIMIDGAAYSLMVGLGEAYLSAFGLALGLSGVAVGLLATVPMLGGGVLQMISPRAVARLGSHRRWVVLCAGCQTLSLLAMPLAPLLGDGAGWLLFAAATIYWGAGLATGPAWNTWVENLVPRHVRTRFFAERVRITQVAVMAGFVAAGVLLHAGKQCGQPLSAFALLFVTAALCRFVSTAALARQSESPPDERQFLAPRSWTVGLRGDGCGRLLAYLLTVQVAVQICGPYFTPFMLGELRLSYLHYMLLIGAAYFGKVAALPTLGRLAQRFGARRLLWIGGLGIVPGAGLWIVSQSFWYLLGVQLLTGACWAAYELAMFLMFFESIPKDRRTGVLTIYNLGNAAALAGGALLGGALLSLLGPGPAAYLTLFGLSSALRVLALLLLRRVPEPDRQPTAPATRVISMQPEGGADARPILSSLEPEAA